jgi:hypothetical protein
MNHLSIVRYGLGLYDRTGEPLSSFQQEAATTILGTALQELFGGCTIYNTRGFWDFGQEPSLIFEAYGELSDAEAAWPDTEAESDKQLFLKQAAARAALAANQEAVMLVISSAPGALSFVGQPVFDAAAAVRL